MEHELEYPLAEVVGKPFQGTEKQMDRLAALDWYIEELGVVMQENKEYGVLQAQWRHNDRFNKWLYEGVDNNSHKV